MDIIGIIIFLISILTLGIGYYFKLFPGALFQSPLYQIFILAMLIIEVQNDGWIGLMQTLTCVLISVAYLLAFKKGYADRTKSNQENK